MQSEETINTPQHTPHHVPLSPEATRLLMMVCREMAIRGSQLVRSINSQMALRADLDVNHIQIYQRELEASQMFDVYYDLRENFAVSAQRTCYRLRSRSKRGSIAA